MYRNDRDALSNEVDDLRHELERVRAENEAMRGSLMLPAKDSTITQGTIYRSVTPQLIPAGHRAAYAHHELAHLDRWKLGLAHVVTLGLASLVHFGLVHGRLPKVADDDPTPGRAIGFMFIPYFNLYWVFQNALRLVDRLNLQFTLREQPRRVSRPLIVAACVVTVIPYLNMLLAPVVWFFAAMHLQQAVNDLAAEGSALPADLLRDASPAEARVAAVADEAARVRGPRVLDPDALTAAEHAPPRMATDDGEAVYEAEASEEAEPLSLRPGAV